MPLDDEIVEIENRMNALGSIFRRNCIQLDVVEIVRCLSRTDQPGLGDVRCESIDRVQWQPGKQSMGLNLLPVGVSKLLMSPKDMYLPVVIVYRRRFEIVPIESFERYLKLCASPGHKVKGYGAYLLVHGWMDSQIHGNPGYGEQPKK